MHEEWVSLNFGLPPSLSAKRALTQPSLNARSGPALASHRMTEGIQLSQCPFGKKLNLMNHLQFKGGGPIREGAAEGDARKPPEIQA